MKDHEIRTAFYKDEISYEWALMMLKKIGFSSDNADRYLYYDI